MTIKFNILHIQLHVICNLAIYDSDVNSFESLSYVMHVTAGGRMALYFYIINEM